VGGGGGGGGCCVVGWGGREGGETAGVRGRPVFWVGGYEGGGGVGEGAGGGGVEGSSRRLLIVLAGVMGTLPGGETPSQPRKKGKKTPTRKRGLKFV